MLILTGKLVHHLGPSWPVESSLQLWSEQQSNILAVAVACGDVRAKGFVLLEIEERNKVEKTEV